MSDFTIRAFSADDRNDVIKLWSECGLVVPQNNPQLDIERKMQVNSEWFLVGEIGGKIIATCMAGYEGHRGWINYLAVSPQYRRQGLAARLMREAEKILQNAGCPKINLQVRTSNKDVIEFYKSAGFRKDDVISMGKRLIKDRAAGTG